MNNETLIAVFTAGTAVFTAGTAAAAALATRATRRSTEAQVFSALMSEYGSREMSEALRELGAWEKGYSSSGQPFKQATDSWGKDLASPRPSDETLRRNEQRRLVAHFFWKTSSLIEEKFLRGGLAKELTSHAGKNVMLNVVLPLEMVLRSTIGADSAESVRLEDRFKRVFFPTGVPRLAPPLTPRG